MMPNIHFWSYLAQFFSKWETFQTKVVEKVKTRILCSVTFFRKSGLLWDNVEKPVRTGRTTDDNMEHVHYILHTLGYKHTNRICNIINFPLLQWLHERASVYVHFLPSLMIRDSGSRVAEVSLYLEKLRLTVCLARKVHFCNVFF